MPGILLKVHGTRKLFGLLNHFFPLAMVGLVNAQILKKRILEILIQVPI